MKQGTILILNVLLRSCMVSVYSCQQESYPKIGWEFEFPENLSKKKTETLFYIGFSPIR